MLPREGGGQGFVARRLPVVLASAALLGALGDGARPAGSAAAPAYDASGALLRPQGYRSWVFVGA
ncbi:MAG TPA: hypothetical protein VNH43_14095, partial [Vicinamibacteria bacterium]|nr:hypothetical protein [Vicinamibacteria bacterium]